MAMFEIHTVDEQINALPTVDTASGSIATFNTDLTENLISCVADIPSDGVSEINVTRCGKNLFDKSNSSIILESYLLKSGDTYYIASGINVFTAFVRCKANTTYTISKIAGSRFVIGWTKELPANGVTYYGYTAGSALSSLTVTTGNDAQYIVAYFYNGTYPDGYTYNDYLNSLQIEENNQATTYEAYNGNTYNVQFGSTILGGTIDLVTGKIIDGSYNVSYANSVEISALNGLNNIWCDTGDTEVKYLLTLGRVS